MSGEEFTPKQQNVDDTAGMSAAVPKGKRGGLLLWFGGIAVLLLAVPVLILGWLGVMPGLSNALGTNKPEELGVRYTQTDYDNYLNKSGIRFSEPAAAPDHPTKPGKKQTFANPRQLDTTFTQEELSAAINSADFPWMPLSHVQLKLSDNTAEISGQLNPSRVQEFARLIGGFGHSEAEISRALGYAERMGANLPVYIKATGSVQDARLSMQLQDVRVGRFDVSPNLAPKLKVTGIEKTIGASENFAIQTATLQNGSMAFTGILPTTIYVKRN